MEDIDRNIAAMAVKARRTGGEGLWKTADDFAGPEYASGWYLHNGELKQDMGNAQPRHEIAKADLLAALILHCQSLPGVKPRVCAETAYELNLYTVLIPDISVQMPPQPREGRFFSKSPDLAIEILSPCNSWKELKAKAQAYLAHGSSLVCVVDPEAGQVWTVSETGTLESIFDLSVPGTDQTLDLRPLLDAWRG